MASSSTKGSTDTINNAKPNALSGSDGGGTTARHFSAFSGSAPLFTAEGAAGSSSSTSAGVGYSHNELLSTSELGPSASPPRARILLLTGDDDEALGAALLSDFAAHSARGTRVCSLLTAVLPYFGPAQSTSSASATVPYWLEFVRVPPRILPSTKAILYDGAHAIIGVHRAQDGRSLDACWIAVSTALEYLKPVLASPRLDCTSGPTFPVLIAAVSDSTSAVATPTASETARDADSDTRKLYFKTNIVLLKGRASGAYESLSATFFKHVVAARCPRPLALDHASSSPMISSLSHFQHSQNQKHYLMQQNDLTQQQQQPQLHQQYQKQQQYQEQHQQSQLQLSPRQLSPPSIPRLLAEQRRRQFGNRTKNIVSSINSLIPNISLADERYGRRRLASSASELFNLKDS